jgi:hypothetical protein
LQSRVETWENSNLSAAERETTSKLFTGLALKKMLASSSSRSPHGEPKILKGSRLAIEQVQEFGESDSDQALDEVESVDEEAIPRRKLEIDNKVLSLSIK